MFPHSPVLGNRSQICEVWQFSINPHTTSVYGKLPNLPNIASVCSSNCLNRQSKWSRELYKMWPNTFWIQIYSLQIREIKDLVDLLFFLLSFNQAKHPTIKFDSLWKNRKQDTDSKFFSRVIKFSITLSQRTSDLTIIWSIMPLPVL